MQAVAYYSAPYEAVGRLGILPSSLVMALFPAFSVLKGGGQEGKIRSIFARSIKIVMVASGTFVVLIVLLARTILSIWLGGDFAARSGLVFQLIAASFIFLSFIYVAFSLLQGVGRTDLPARIHLVLLAVYRAPALGRHQAGRDRRRRGRLAGPSGPAGRAPLPGRPGGSDTPMPRRSCEVGLARVLFGLAVFAAAGGALSLALPAPAAAVVAAAGFAPLLWFWILSRRGEVLDLRRRLSGKAAALVAEAEDMNGSRPRLLLVGLVPPEVGGCISCGVASHVFELGQQAAARGYETSILAPLRPGREVRRAPSIRLLNASRPRTTRVLSGGWAAIRRGGLVPVLVGLELAQPGVRPVLDREDPGGDGDDPRGDRPRPSLLASRRPRPGRRFRRGFRSSSRTMASGRICAMTTI